MSNLKTMYGAQTNSPYTTTLGELAANTGTVTVADASVLPQVPFLLTLGYDKSAAETVLVTAITGNALTITRGVDGQALTWATGTKCARIFTAKDLNDVQDNIKTLDDEKQEKIAISGLLKSNGNGQIVKAQAGTDYQTPLTAETDYVTPSQVNSLVSSKAEEADLTAHTGDTSNPHGVTAQQAGAVPEGRTVNGKALTGNIALTATDVGARPDTWTPTASDVGARPDTWMPTAAEVGADEAGTAAELINRTSRVNASDTSYTSYIARGESLNAEETTPTVNGAIAWIYG